MALRGEFEGAAAAFERSRDLDPDAVEPALNLFEAYQSLNRSEEAEALAAELLRRWPTDQSARVAVARFNEWRGACAEALALLRSPGIDVGANSPAYPDYLRLLLADGRFEEAVLEARRGRDSLYRPDALLTMAIGQLKLGEADLASKTLALLDLDEYAELLKEWGERLSRSKIAEQIAPVVKRAAAATSGGSSWDSLHRALTR